MSQFVYFLKPVERLGPIKIGCSREPHSRLETFMAWSPFPLELIGRVPGDTKDENYLHRCFWDRRSHGEWFHHSVELREAIDRILVLGVVSRDIVSPNELKSRPGRKRTPEQSRLMSYRMRIDWALRKMRTDEGYWSAPQDIRKILDDWSAWRGLRKPPTQENIERLESFLCNPAGEAIFHAIRRVAA